jgi:hypothetical protein
MPAVDVVAANDAYLRTFPGLQAGDNILEWQLLNPVAREVIEEWERETHFLVYGFRHLANGLIPPERHARIVRACSASPDWERLWSTDIPPADLPRRPGRLKSPETGEWITVSVQIFRFELPRRPWWLYTLTPVPLLESAI